MKKSRFLAAAKVLHDFYMDDLLTGVANIEEAVQLKGFNKIRTVTNPNSLPKACCSTPGSHGIFTAAIWRTVRETYDPE